MFVIYFLIKVGYFRPITLMKVYYRMIKTIELQMRKTLKVHIDYKIEARYV